MASKKNKPATTNAANLPALKIGSRVRCTDDGVEGRIVRANGLMVTITWSDGEKVTWRRDTLASKPIEILDDETAPASQPHYMFCRPRARRHCRRRKTSSHCGLICTGPKPISSGCGSFPPMPWRRHMERHWDNGHRHATTPKHTNSGSLLTARATFTVASLRGVITASSASS